MSCSFSANKPKTDSYALNILIRKEYVLNGTGATHLLELQRMRGLSIAGQGARIIIANPTAGFLDLDHCSNVTVSPLDAFYHLHVRGRTPPLQLFCKMHLRGWIQQ